MMWTHQFYFFFMEKLIKVWLIIKWRPKITVYTEAMTKSLSYNVPVTNPRPQLNNTVYPFSDLCRNLVTMFKLPMHKTFPFQSESPLKIRKISVYHSLISLLVSELLRFKELKND